VELRKQLDDLTQAHEEAAQKYQVHFYLISSFISFLF